jgi:hypothetical protein
MINLHSHVLAVPTHPGCASVRTCLLEQEPTQWHIPYEWFQAVIMGSVWNQKKSGPDRWSNWVDTGRMGQGDTGAIVTRVPSSPFLSAGLANPIRLWQDLFNYSTPQFSPS